MYYLCTRPEKTYLLNPRTGTPNLSFNYDRKE